MAYSRKVWLSRKFIKLFRLFYDGMKAYVYVGGNISEAIPVENGVKQGDIPAPTLFALYFTMVLVMAFKECSTGIYIRYRTSGKLFNIRRFGATAKLRRSLIREFCTPMTVIYLLTLKAISNN